MGQVIDISAIALMGFSGALPGPVPEPESQDSSEIIEKLEELGRGVGMTPEQMSKFFLMIFVIQSQFAEKVEQSEVAKHREELGDKTFTVLLQMLENLNEPEWSEDPNLYRALFEVLNVKMTKIHHGNEKKSA